MVISMDRWVGKVAVVTGASSGIGYALAERLVKEGLQVAALARRKDRLEQLAAKVSGESGKLFPIPTDVSKEEDILKAFKWIRENLGPVHILINNAAVSPSGNLYDGDTKTWEAIFKTNVLGLCIGTREAIKDMKDNHVDGHIIHINSIAGHQVLNLPGINVYTAAKYAVTALAETLRLELNTLKSKIKITSVSPGVVQTEMITGNGVALLPGFQEMISQQAILLPEDLADAVIYALSTPPHVQIQELTIRTVIEEF